MLQACGTHGCARQERQARARQADAGPAYGRGAAAARRAYGRQAREQARRGRAGAHG